MNNKKNKVAIITGASRGIGKTVATQLVEKGYIVGMVAKNADTLDDFAYKLNQQSSSGTVIPYALDIANEDDVKNVINDFLHKEQSIDLLFNNAGIVHRGSSSISNSEQLKMLDTNLIGLMNFVRSVVPVMKRYQSGYIINVSSRSAIYPKSQNGGYAATKAAIRAYSDSLYQELAKHNIKVTTIFPSYTHTDQSSGQKWLRDEHKIDPKAIYQTIEYLLSLSPTAAIKEIILDCSHVVAYGENYQ